MVKKMLLATILFLCLSMNFHDVKSIKVVDEKEPKINNSIYYENTNEINALI